VDVVLLILIAIEIRSLTVLMSAQMIVANKPLASVDVVLLITIPTKMAPMIVMKSVLLIRSNLFLGFVVAG
jgi:hypothetical protein